MAQPAFRQHGGGDGALPPPVSHIDGGAGGDRLGSPGPGSPGGERGLQSDEKLRVNCLIHTKLLYAIRVISR